MTDHVQATITINAEPKAVMAAIADIASYPSWSGPVERARVLEADADGRPLRASFVVNAMITKDEFVLAYEWADEKVGWRLLESKMMKSQVGSYALRDLGDGRTEVTYDLTAELAVKLPGPLRRRAQGAVADAALKDLKKHLES